MEKSRSQILRKMRRLEGQKQNFWKTYCAYQSLVVVVASYPEEASYQEEQVVVSYLEEVDLANLVEALPPVVVPASLEVAFSGPYLKEAVVDQKVDLLMDPLQEICESEINQPTKT